jgi:hypothetical protein
VVVSSRVCSLNDITSDIVLARTVAEATSMATHEVFHFNLVFQEVDADHITGLKGLVVVLATLKDHKDEWQRMVITSHDSTV